MDIVETVKKFIKAECQKPGSKYGGEPFEFHFKPVVRYAGELADELGGDKEVILLAAWLHDIGSIRHGRQDHHLTGVKIAEQKLQELKYPATKIALVKECILHHRGSRNDKRETIEEQIIADADAMSHFDNISGIFKAAFAHEGQTQDEAQVSTRQKLENSWRKLHSKKSRQIIKPKYEAAMILLKKL